MTALAEGVRLQRVVPWHGLIDFEESPTFRAYYWTPEGQCTACEGSGREPGARRGTTRKCAACDGTGLPKRQRMTSVTTILNQILPKDLTRWGEERGIEGVMTALRRGELDASTSPDRAVEIVRTLKLGAEAARDTAASRGVNVHALLEEYMRNGTVPNAAEHLPEHHGFIKGLCRFLLKYDPQPLSDGTGIEDLVCDPDAGFAGRSDLRCLIREKVIRLDAKTQARGNIYAGAHLQLGLYERGGLFCGDGPSDELWALALPADGELPDPMVVDVSAAQVDAALTYWRAVKPIDGACQARNKVRRETLA